jgi:hypothetical protein
MIHHHGFLILSLFSHAADAQMRCIQVRYKCQGMSLLMPLKPLKKSNSLLPQAVAEREPKNQPNPGASR